MPGEPGLLCHSDTQVSRLATPAAAAEPKISLKSFLQPPTGPGHTAPLSTVQLRQGSEVLLRYSEYRKIILRLWEGLLTQASPNSSPGYPQLRGVCRELSSSWALRTGKPASSPHPPGQLASGLLAQWSSAGPTFWLTEWQMEAQKILLDGVARV